jgi:serine/threonine-protein kinase
MREQEIRLEGGQQRELSVELERDRGTSNPGTRPTTTSTPTTPATPSGPGMLTVAATPWCNVSVDGRAVGETPVVNHSLPSGRHTITCTNPELNVTRTRTAEIRAGETTRVRIELQE